MLNTRGAWRHPLYVRAKVIAICRDHVDETVVHVLREIMPECVLKLVSGLYPNIPDTIPRTQVVLKVGDVCFSFFRLFPLLCSCTSYVYAGM